jgi:hypothetical protein
MAFFEDIFKGGNVVTGLAIGIGGVILAPMVAPVLVSVVKPAAKAAMRGGLALYEGGLALYGKGRDATVEAGEALSDLVAEARSELEQEAEERRLMRAEHAKDL